MHKGKENVERGKWAAYEWVWVLWRISRSNCWVRSCYIRLYFVDQTCVVELQWSIFEWSKSLKSNHKITIWKLSFLLLLLERHQCMEWNFKLDFHLCLFLVHWSLFIFFHVTMKHSHTLVVYWNYFPSMNEENPASF